MHARTVKVFIWSSPRDVIIVKRSQVGRPIFKPVEGGGRRGEGEGEEEYTK